MDFFAQQDKARRHTKLLVVYFVIAVVLIMAAVYLVGLFVSGAAVHRVQRFDYETTRFSWWDPKVFLFAVGGTLAVIVIGSATKTMQLAGGGSAVATTLGGRPLNPNTNDPDERKLLNVVEEMAIASGVPVPQVYVLDNEKGINAFAAGHTTSDAVVCVTRGCMKLLSRDELQGVVGHEFSHILNGDMRLNIRLIGIIFGILCLATIGRILLYTRSRDSRNNIGPLVGIALLLIGGIGVFFGRLIQAAVSRQREFLADASSVQFTRNPAGISGALQKIGRYGYGSHVDSQHAPDMCHMFFGNGVREPLFNLMATHPPIPERIRAVDPTWDGKFPPLKPEQVEVVEKAAISELKQQSSPFPGIFGLPLAGAMIMGSDEERPTRQPPVIKSRTVLPNLGNPTPLHLRYAEQLRNSLPDSIQAAARETSDAVALIYAMLLSPDEKTRAMQLAELAKRVPQPVYTKTVALYPDATAAAAHAHLPMINLALGALRHLSAEQYEQFSQTLQWLIESDGKVELFEFVLQKIIRHHLESQFSKIGPPVIQFYSIKPLVPDCVVLVSALANVGSDNDADVGKAFEAGAPYLRAPDGNFGLLPKEQCGVTQIDAALDRLSQAAPQIKKNLIEACIHTVGADGVIQESEAELLRAIADTLDCPIPPFVSME